GGRLHHSSDGAGNRRRTRRGRRALASVHGIGPAPGGAGCAGQRHLRLHGVAPVNTESAAAAGGPRRAWRATGEYIRRYGYRILVGLALTALFALHAAKIVEIPIVNQLELMAYDMRLRLTLP